MPERTDHATPDEALHRVFTQPSLASKVLLHIAGELVAVDPAGILTETGLRIAIVHSALEMLRSLPAAVRDNALQVALTALPPVNPDATRGEYALHLRRAARSIR